jgi:hypothetical protein
MHNNEHYYKLAKARQEEIMRKIATDLWLGSARKKNQQKINPRLVWALVGPVFAVVILSLLV